MNISHLYQGSKERTHAACCLLIVKLCCITVTTSGVSVLFYNHREEHSDQKFIETYSLDNHQMKDQIRKVIAQTMDLRN
jgi:hypothetical protein